MPGSYALAWSGCRAGIAGYSSHPPRRCLLAGKSPPNPPRRCLLAVMPPLNPPRRCLLTVMPPLNPPGRTHRLVMPSLFSPRTRRTDPKTLKKRPKGGTLHIQQEQEEAPCTYSRRYPGGIWLYYTVPGRHMALLHSTGRYTPPQRLLPG